MSLSGMKPTNAKKKKKKKNYKKKKNSTRENTVSVTRFYIEYVEAKKNIFLQKKKKTCAKLCRSGRSQIQRTMNKWIIDLTVV